MQRKFLAASRGRRLAAALAAAVVLGSAAAGIAAATTGPVADSSFVTITPFQTFSGPVSGTMHTSFTVIGGTGPVPSDASEVQLSVAVNATTAGKLRFYPASDAKGIGNQSVAYGVGASSDQVTESVGAANEVTMANTTGAATVTVDVVAYSTLSTAIGGGQPLGGDVALPGNGLGINFAVNAVNAVTVNQTGSYAVTFTGQAKDVSGTTTPDEAECDVQDQSNAAVVASAFTSNDAQNPMSSLSATVLVSDNSQFPGPFAVLCSSTASTEQIVDPSLTITPIANAQGVVQAG